jgi:hypothetical protein
MGWLRFPRPIVAQFFAPVDSQRHRRRRAAVVGVLSSREVPDDSGISNRAYAVPIELVNAWRDTMPKQEEEKFYLFDLAGR